MKLKFCIEHQFLALPPDSTGANEYLHFILRYDVIDFLSGID